MHDDDDELAAIRQHLSQTPTEGASALAGALADEGAMSATSIHEGDDELSAIRQHPSQTPSEGAGALAGSLAGKDALAGAGALADEGAISATSIHEDDDDPAARKQHLRQTPTEEAGTLEYRAAPSLPSRMG